MRAARFLPIAILGVLTYQGVSLHAAEPGWRHLSSKKGDLPVPGKSTQQTACLIADLDRSGRNGFVLGFRVTGPALVWYRPTAKGWDRLVIEPEFLTIEAGGAAPISTATAGRIWSLAATRTATASGGGAIPAMTGSRRALGAAHDQEIRQDAAP